MPISLLLLAQTLPGFKCWGVGEKSHASLGRTCSRLVTRRDKHQIGYAHDFTSRLSTKLTNLVSKTSFVKGAVARSLLKHSYLPGHRQGFGYLQNCCLLLVPLTG